METPLRRKDIPPQRRQQIFEAAAELFSHSGYHGVTVDAIARRAGISKGNLYWYFSSKQEIFQLLIDQIAEKLFVPLLEAMSKEAPPREKLRALARSCLDAADASPESVQLMWQIVTQPELKEYLSSEFRLWINPFIEYLTPLFGEMGERDPEGTAMLYAFMLDALTFLAVVGPGVYDRERLLGAIERKLLTFGEGSDV
jgi:AcrR family transcriptional regulator